MEVLLGRHNMTSVKCVITGCHWQLFTHRLELSRWSKEPHIVHSSRLIHQSFDKTFCYDTEMKEKYMWMQPAWALKSTNTICIAFIIILLSLIKYYSTALHVELATFCLFPVELKARLHTHFSFPSSVALIQYLWVHVIRSVFMQWPLSTTYLQLQRCSHSHWPTGLQLCLRSPCSHTRCVQNKLSEW